MAAMAGGIVEVILGRWQRSSNCCVFQLPTVVVVVIVLGLQNDTAVLRCAGTPARAPPPTIAMGCLHMTQELMVLIVL